MLASFVPPSALPVSSGLYTKCPSATPLGLTLGPDLPRADEPSPGNLGFSTDGILTHLLVTYTGILSTIQSNLTLVRSSPRIVRSPTNMFPYSAASVVCLAPVHFRRRVARLVSYYALF